MTEPEMPKETALVRLSGIGLALAGRQVLNGVDLSLSERRVGIVGRNGSGKSTLARVMTGLVAPDAGVAEVMGIDVLRDRRAAIRAVGILFQNPEHQIIFPTVGEELGFGLRQQGMRKADVRERVRAMLDRFGRAHWLERSVDALSQGQKHLVCLMAVLMTEPALIVLDEPFTGLDIPTTRALRRHFERLAPMLVHITHDIDALEGYDRVIWIDDGRVHRDGAAAPVLAEYIDAMMQEGEADAGACLAD